MSYEDHEKEWQRLLEEMEERGDEREREEEDEEILEDEGVGKRKKKGSGTSDSSDDEMGEIAKDDKTSFWKGFDLSAVKGLGSPEVLSDMMEKKGPKRIKLLPPKAPDPVDVVRSTEEHGDEAIATGQLDQPLLDRSETPAPRVATPMPSLEDVLQSANPSRLSFGKQKALVRDNDGFFIPGEPASAAFIIPSSPRPQMMDLVPRKKGVGKHNLRRKKLLKRGKKGFADDSRRSNFLSASPAAPSSPTPWSRLSGLRLGSEESSKPSDYSNSGLRRPQPIHDWRIVNSRSLEYLVGPSDSPKDQWE